MENSIQILDPFVPLEIEVVNAMLDLADLKPNNKFIDLGSGDGRFLTAALLRKAKPVIGYEIDQDLVNSISLQPNMTVIKGDLMQADVSTADVVTFWFTIGVDELIDKLYNEMKSGARLVCLHNSRQQYRDGAYVPEESYPIPNHVWQPSEYRDVLGNRIYLYIR